MLIWTTFLTIWISTQNADLNQTSSLDEFDSLIHLMYLTERTCGSINWCTVRNGNVPLVRTGCCVPCSCRKSCLLDRTCCPDYISSLRIGGFIFNNIFICNETYYNNNSISNINNTDVYKELSDDNETNYNNDHISNIINTEFYKELSDDDTTKCMPSQIKAISQRRPKQPFYYMIVKCSNSNVQQETREMCENLNVYYVKEIITNFIPVQSSKTGLVYRNKFCLQCNEEINVTYNEWEVYISSLVLPHILFSDKIISLYDFLRTMLGPDTYEAYDVVFLPDKSSKQTSCEHFDVTSCPDDNNSSRIDRDACSLYKLPVYGYLGGRITVFNNLQCIACLDHPLDIFSVCRYFYNWNQRPFMGRINRYLLEQANDSNTFSSSPERPTTCARRFLYDSNSTSCRKLYCPCGMVLHKGSCVHIFTEIRNKLYHVDVLVTVPKENVGTGSIEAGLYDYIEKTFHSSSALKLRHAIALTPKPEKKVMKNCVIFLIFMGESTTTIFSEVVAFVGKHFRGKQTIITNGLKHVVTMAISGNIPNLIGNQLKLGGYKASKPISDVGTDALLVERNLIHISECNFCYMVKTEPGEVEERRNVILIKKSGVVLHKSGYSYIMAQPQNEHLKILVCAGRIFEQSFDISNTFHFGNQSNNTLASSMNKTNELGIATIVMLVAVIMIVCILRIVKSRIKKNRNHAVQYLVQQNQVCISAEQETRQNHIATIGDICYD